ncbi:MAG: class I SAM-dependent methyltransferase [Actinomycetes bacterium]|jgi:O-methyltransferase involved in polyketide biosynthesis|nr:class I SAM-dependent methyltransferase [Actinomycetes bacterium]
MEKQALLQAQTVQSTMLLALYGRAKASRMFPDILNDAEAIDIVDTMDYDFTEIDKSFGTEYASLCCLLRAKRLDERCHTYLQQHPNGTVINLGAGLDTTLSRIDNGSVYWYNIDLPDSIAYRHQYIAAPERCTDIAKSAFDYTWFPEIETLDDSVFVLAGGLFYYFEEAQVRELISRMGEHFPKGEIFFDAQSKTTVRISNRIVRKTGNTSSEMHFYVNNPRELKNWSPHIRTIESIPFFAGLWKERRFKLSSKINMWGFDTLKMGKLISIQWG